jgi:predicted GNAT family N-acyltransferase
MRTCYVIRLPDNHSIAILDLSKVRGRVYEVNRVNVPTRYRGRGYGRQLLKEVCSEADRFDTLLRLVPMESGGLTAAQLEAWYSRHGFRQHENVYFYREPATEK